MNLEKKFKTLAARARAETPPQVDVAGRVLAILADAQTRPKSFSERVMMWLAALSSAVAVPTAVFAIVVYKAWTDPLMEIFKEISWVIQ